MPVTPDAAPHLRAAGHDAIHAADLGLARASDNELLAVARREGRLVITADLDYPRLIALQHADRPGVILFRGGAYREMLALLDRRRRSYAYPSPPPAHRRVTGSARPRARPW